MLEKPLRYGLLESVINRWGGTSVELGEQEAGDDLYRCLTDRTQDALVVTVSKEESEKPGFDLRRALTLELLILSGPTGLQGLAEAMQSSDRLIVSVNTGPVTPAENIEQMLVEASRLLR